MPLAYDDFSTHAILTARHLEAETGESFLPDPGDEEVAPGVTKRQAEIPVMSPFDLATGEFVMADPDTFAEKFIPKE